MKRLSTLVLPLLVVASLAACKSKQNEAQQAPASAQETPAAAVATAPEPATAPAAPATAAAPGAKFDLQSVSVTDKALPAFPYLATPTGLKENDLSTSKDLEFDRVFVLAGEELRPVEGKVNERLFYIHNLKWSPLAAHRNYEAALKAMGATRVDKIHPTNPQLVERNGGNESEMLKKMGVGRLDDLKDPEVPGYEQWLIRTPTTNIWLSFFLKGDDELHLLTVEEKAMQQLVETLPAAKLSSALKQDGHVALYLNFDTDSKVIRQDSLPAVDEVVKLMQGEPALKLRVEGHTDATGDAAHNRKLSLARAESVVQAITAKNIAAQRLSAAGKGPDQPLADNGSEEGKAKNRRVELVRV